MFCVHIAPRAGKQLLYAVLLDEVEHFAELEAEHGRARSEYVASLQKLQRLLLEGALGEHGSLMILQAESFAEVVSVLQKDPYVTEQISSSVQIRPLEINVLGDMKMFVRSRTDRDERDSDAARESEQEEICPIKGK
jgi:uncharacterized protein YciI